MQQPPLVTKVDMPVTCLPIIFMMKDRYLSWVQLIIPTPTFSILMVAVVVVVVVAPTLAAATVVAGVAMVSRSPVLPVLISATNGEKNFLFTEAIAILPAAAR